MSTITSADLVKAYTTAIEGEDLPKIRAALAAILSTLALEDRLDLETMVYKGRSKDYKILVNACVVNDGTELELRLIEIPSDKDVNLGQFMKDMYGAWGAEELVEYISLETLEALRCVRSRSSSIEYITQSGQFCAGIEVATVVNKKITKKEAVYRKKSWKIPTPNHPKSSHDCHQCSGVFSEALTRIQVPQGVP